MRQYVFKHTRGLEDPILITTNLDWETIGTPIGFFLHSINKI